MASGPYIAHKELETFHVFQIMILKKKKQNRKDSCMLVIINLII